jgi:bacterioferritin-associated ferredoxin
MINYCGVCGDEPGPIQTVCKDCRKAARQVFKSYTTDEQFLNHECDHVAMNPKLNIQDMICGWRRRIPKQYEIPYSHLQNLEDPKSKCAVCRDEMRKELALRYRKNRRRKPMEPLLTKCCRVIALDPGLLLLAAVHDPPLGEQIWEKINDEVPQALTKEYNEALDESQSVNDAEWMYRTLGEVFSRYIRRRRG